MPWYWWAVAAVGVGAAATVRGLRGVGKEVLHERARESFRLQKERYEARFLAAAAATGKPRGLIWTDCAFDGTVELVRDAESKKLLGLVPVSIKFEAVADGPMDGVEAVGNVRYATAVFAFERGQWITQGRALFNMHPHEAIEHFRGQFQRV